MTVRMNQMRVNRMVDGYSPKMRLEGMTKVDVGGRPKKEQIEGNLRVSFL